MYLLGSEFTASEVTPLYPILLGERKVLDLMVSGIEKIKENVEEILYAFFLKKADIRIL